jgi:hypothetical protein
MAILIVYADFARDTTTQPRNPDHIDRSYLLALSSNACKLF